jgi:large subunit ribosomal protein L21
MYAVIEIGGRQLRVSPEQSVRVPKMAAQVGDSVTFDRVYAVRKDEDFMVGAPTVDGAKVLGTVVSHGKADKILVYKYKRRKYYRRKKGHRQPFTEVKISEIVV